MNGARILLGVTGGIAAYKAAALTSTLVQSGAIVDVIMTAEAERFITPLTFSALTARPVYTSLWDAPERIPHIRLVREAQVALVAPATANFLAKLAAGIADDLLTTALLAARIPVLVAPAMNAAMYEHATVVQHLRELAERGIQVVDPESGFLAERESGPGRLASEERLLDALRHALTPADGPLRGKRVLITAGPTREPIDPVRHLSNASTGSMGIALAREALVRGARVTLILGPTALGAPAGAQTIRVTTAQEMYDAALAHASDAQLTIATAAVSDYRAATVASAKLKKTDAQIALPMVRNPDILKTLGEIKHSGYLVGFAAETHAHEANALQKLRDKNLDAIAVNDVAAGRGFGLQENALTLLFADGSREDLGTSSKAELAGRLLDAVSMKLGTVHDAAGN